MLKFRPRPITTRLITQSTPSQKDSKDQRFLLAFAAHATLVPFFVSYLSLPPESIDLPIEEYCIESSAMAACRSLQHIFENPLPENPTLLESLSLNQIKPVKPIEQGSFTEIFGELHFKESPDLSFPPSASSSSSSLDSVPQKDILRAPETKSHSKSLRSSGSLQLCTEGLGFESSDDVEELKNGMNQSWETVSEKKEIPLGNSTNGEYYCRKSGISPGETDYPPPISCIGKNGKPWVCFRSYRDNGRLVLKEIRIPTQEFLHAHRENGRLRLNFVQPDDDVFLQEAEAEEEEEEAEKEDEEDEEEEEEEEEAEDDNEDGEGGACETDQVNAEKDIDVKM